MLPFALNEKVFKTFMYLFFPQILLINVNEHFMIEYMETVTWSAFIKLCFNDICKKRKDDTHNSPLLVTLMVIMFLEDLYKELCLYACVRSSLRKWFCFPKNAMPM